MKTCQSILREGVFERFSRLVVCLSPEALSAPGLLVKAQLQVLGLLWKCIEPLQALENGGQDALRAPARRKMTVGFAGAYAKFLSWPETFADSSADVREQLTTWGAKSLQPISKFLESKDKAWKKQALLSAKNWLEQAVKQASPFAEGGPNASSWKRDAPEKSTFEQLVEIGQQHLLKKEVASKIMNGFSALQKEPGD